MNTGTVELMQRGMNCLMEHLGTIDAQRFISAVLREKFDYTQWHRDFFDNVTAEEFAADALQWASSHPGIVGGYATDTSRDKD
ncbi:MAG: hypothetical protein IJU76_04285 [Desulfovibrionaceae bacterium]|nr:hypothetical protein [Desulfovibrionaceae bacterium]